MALDQETDLLNGYKARYWRLVEWTVSTEKQEATGTFKVYRDREQSNLGCPATHRIARLDIRGERYVEFFGNREPGVTDQVIFYRAAREMGVISDLGPAPDPADKTIKRGHRALFKGAQDVLEVSSTNPQMQKGKGSRPTR